MLAEGLPRLPTVKSPSPNVVATLFSVVTVPLLPTNKLPSKVSAPILPDAVNVDKPVITDTFTFVVFTSVAFTVVILPVVAFTVVAFDSPLVIKLPAVTVFEKIAPLPLTKPLPGSVP